MKIKKLFILFFMGIMFPYVSYAQIGYQVSLLNKTTGKPRANVTVDAKVTITNSEDEEIYKGTQRATSNDLGVVQLKVGNQGTFKDVNWNKLPFFIEVSVGGTVIGKSQILTVPIAEAAKYLAPGIDIEDLVGTWKCVGYDTELDIILLNFSSNDSGSLKILWDGDENDVWEWSFKYYVMGDLIVTYQDQTYRMPGIDMFTMKNNKIFGRYGAFTKL